MLLSLNGRRVYFDLAGPANAPVVCFTHSLNSDGGMWVEQMVPLLAAGYRVLRLDMRGHGGSAPVEGDYTMDALAGDVKGALDVLGIAKVHFIGLSIGGRLPRAPARHARPWRQRAGRGRLHHGCAGWRREGRARRARHRQGAFHRPLDRRPVTACSGSTCAAMAAARRSRATTPWMRW